MSRKSKEVSRAALAQLHIARHRDLPFLHTACPLCHGTIQQTSSGDRRRLRHFDCPVCGFWAIIADEDIEQAILGAADPEGYDTASGSNGGAWFNPETGRLNLIASDEARRRWKEQQTAGRMSSSGDRSPHSLYPKY